MMRVNWTLPLAAVLGLAGLVALLSPQAGAAVQTPGVSALDIAEAMEIDSQPNLVQSASFVMGPGPSGGVSGFANAEFPTNSDSYGIIASSSAQQADGSGGTPSSAGSGASHTEANDVIILKVDIKVPQPPEVPQAHNCLMFDFRFFSDEYPDWVGQQFNDAFIAEFDNQGWTVDSSGAINAPYNFAVFPDSLPITVNNAASGINADNAAGTPWGGGTDKLTAATKIPAPGMHTVYFSIFDSSDSILDSASFLDRLHTKYVKYPDLKCKGIVPIFPLVADAGPDFKVRKHTDLVTGLTPLPEVTFYPFIDDTTGVDPYTCTWTAIGSGITFLHPPADGCTVPRAKFSKCGANTVQLSVKDSQNPPVEIVDTVQVDVYCDPIASAKVNNQPNNCVDSKVDFYTGFAKDTDTYQGSAPAPAPDLPSADWAYAWSTGTPFTAYLAPPSTTVTQGNIAIPGTAKPDLRMLFPAGAVSVGLVVTDDDPTSWQNPGPPGGPVPPPISLQGSVRVSTAFTSIGDPPCMPTLDALPNLRVPTGSRVRIQLQGHDLDHPDGTGLIYSIVGSGFFGYELDADTGLLTWDAVKVQTLCNLKATVKDPLDGSASQTFCITVYRPATDTDSDGGSDQADNCPGVENIDQKDSDLDGVGDACDPSPVGEVVVDPVVEDPTEDPADDVEAEDEVEADTNGDGVVDEEERAAYEAVASAGGRDTDGDGIIDSADNCASQANPDQSDRDADHVGDACDGDIDGDGVPQVGNLATGIDNCPLDANADQGDNDLDGRGDACQGRLVSSVLSGSFDETGRTSSSLDRCRAQRCGASLEAGSTSSGLVGTSAQGAADSSAGLGIGDVSARSMLAGGLLVGSLAFVGVALTTWALRRWS